MPKFYINRFNCLQLFNGLIFYAPVALLVRTQAGMTVSEFLLLEAILSVVIFAGEVPAGMVTDRIGYKNSIVLSQLLLFSARACLLMAFSLEEPSPLHFGGCSRRALERLLLRNL